LVSLLLFDIYWRWWEVFLWTRVNVNYYNKKVKDEFDNETIGIILCTGKKEVTMEYALGGLSNNIFASTYTYYLPNKEQLINEVEKVLIEEKDN